MAVRRVPPPQDGPLQWKHLSPQGRQSAERAVGAIGNARERMTTKRAKLEVAPVSPNKTRANLQRQQRDTLAIADTATVDTKVTTRLAGNRRASLYREGVAAAPAHEAPAGAGWYFEHHRDVAASAEQHGYDKHVAITASAVMSPQNSPDNEKAAVAALMDAHANHTVHMTPTLHSELEAKGAVLDPGHVGQNVPFHALHPSAIAHMSDPTVRPYANTTGANLKDIARGGTKGNVVKAVGVLRGEISHQDALDPNHPDNAINPHSAAKVWSYANAIHNAVPNSPEHIEYKSRVESHATGQEALDLHGMRHARHGILDPEGHTAEDSWMNAVSTGQAIDPIPTGRSGRSSQLSPAKTYGSEAGLGVITSKSDPTTGHSAHESSAIGATAVQHAFNNRATHLAGRTLSRGSGLELPAVAVQEVAWIQARRRAGADPEFKASQAPAPAERPEEVHGQLDLHGGEARAGQSATHAQPSNVLSGHQFAGHVSEGDMGSREQEKSYRMHDAIAGNVRAKRRREGRATHAPVEYDADNSWTHPAPGTVI